MYRLAFVLIAFVFSLHSVASAGLSIREEIEKRWELFQEDREFASFQPGKSDADLKEEFDSISKVRKVLWNDAGYELAEHLIAADLIRAPGCVAFAFNNTEPYYNASTIFLGDKSYIACEGPRSKDVSQFFNLLSSQEVTHLVRLTSSYEGWTKKCHPYWDDLISKSEERTYLNVPAQSGAHQVQVFHMDHWSDHQGVDPQELLSLVLQIRDELNKANGLLVVHCSAGVGRTGTFLAALAILDAIDKDLPLSIEEIVYRLSLQRIHSVAKSAQYITLHRLAELYLENHEF